MPGELIPAWLLQMPVVHAKAFNMQILHRANDLTPNTLNASHQSDTGHAVTPVAAVRPSHAQMEAEWTRQVKSTHIPCPPLLSQADVVHPGPPQCQCSPACRM